MTDAKTANSPARITPEQAWECIAELRRVVSDALANNPERTRADHACDDIASFIDQTERDASELAQLRADAEQDARDHIAICEAYNAQVAKLRAEVAELRSPEHEFELMDRAAREERGLVTAWLKDIAPDSECTLSDYADSIDQLEHLSHRDNQ